MLKTIVSFALPILEKGVIIPILQTRRLKIREVELHSCWQKSQAPNPGLAHGLRTREDVCLCLLTMELRATHSSCCMAIAHESSIDKPFLSYAEDSVCSFSHVSLYQEPSVGSFPS